MRRRERGTPPALALHHRMKAIVAAAVFVLACALPGAVHACQGNACQEIRFRLNRSYKETKGVPATVDIRNAGTRPARVCYRMCQVCFSKNSGVVQCREIWDGEKKTFSISPYFYAWLEEARYVSN